MSMQTSYVKHPVYPKTVYAAPAAKSLSPTKRKANRVINFFNILNPCKWFNDFRDIPMILEESEIKTN